MLNGLQNVLKDFNSTLILKRAKQILNVQLITKRKKLSIRRIAKPFNGF